MVSNCCLRYSRMTNDRSKSGQPRRDARGCRGHGNGVFGADRLAVGFLDLKSRGHGGVTGKWALARIGLQYCGFARNRWGHGGVTGGHGNFCCARNRRFLLRPKVSFVKAIDFKSPISSETEGWPCVLWSVSIPVGYR